MRKFQITPSVNRPEDRGIMQYEVYEWIDGGYVLLDVPVKAQTGTVPFLQFEVED